MVKILPPERLGKIVLDGLVDPYLWREYGGEFFFRACDHTYRLNLI